jgi:hypothetical protein
MIAVDDVIASLPKERQKKIAARGNELLGIEGTDEVTTIHRTTLKLFGVVVTSFVPSMLR